MFHVTDTFTQLWGQCSWCLLQNKLWGTRPRP